MARILGLAFFGLCVLAAAGWLAVRETPAAQHVAETIKPYDPLQ